MPVRGIKLVVVYVWMGLSIFVIIHSRSVDSIIIIKKVILVDADANDRQSIVLTSFRKEKIAVTHRAAHTPIRSISLCPNEGCLLDKRGRHIVRFQGNNGGKHTEIVLISAAIADFDGAIFFKRQRCERSGQKLTKRIANMIRVRILILITRTFEIHDIRLRTV